MHHFCCHRRQYLIVVFLLMSITHSTSDDASDEAAQLDDTNEFYNLTLEALDDQIIEHVRASMEQLNPPELQTNDNGELIEETMTDDYIESEVDTPEINLADDSDNLPDETVDLLVDEEILYDDQETNAESILAEEGEEQEQEQEEEEDEEEIEAETDEEDYYEDEIPLTPEMEKANNLYHQGMALINGTANRQYETAYQLLKEAAELGHMAAKEELAFGHLIGIYLPMDFNISRTYFEEGVQIGSPRSHYGLYFMMVTGLIQNVSIGQALTHLTLAAADGDELGQMALGYRYLQTINVPSNCELALTCYQQTAIGVASEFTTTVNTLVQRIRLYDEDEHATQNNILVDDHLLQYYELLADRGDPQAQFIIGHLYYLRDKAYAKALHYFRSAAEKGNANALGYLGKLHWEKNNYIQQNNYTAVRYFQLAANRGNAIGQAGLGLAYYYGTGVEQSYEKAYKYFHLSADQSYAEAQLMLGVMYYEGKGVKQDFKLALQWFQAASQAGHVLAHYNLAQMYAGGIGVARSCQTAAEYFKSVTERGSMSDLFTKAFRLYNQGHIDQAFMIYLYLAELGYEVAQSNVAYIIDQRSFDIPNIYQTKEERYKKALTYWNRAADQGYHHARVKLGDYYYYGYGTEINYELAAGQYKSASELSRNPQAMFNLAYMHEKGLGLKKDMHLAKRFYDMASETNAEAYLPVALVFLKLYCQSFLERFFPNLFGATNIDPSDVNNDDESVDPRESMWDIYLMGVLFGIIATWYTMRRQRPGAFQR